MVRMILLLECNTLLVLLYELLLLLLLLVLLQLEHPVLLLKLLPLLLLLLLLLPLLIQLLNKLLIFLLTHQPLLLRGGIWLLEAQPPLHKLLLLLRWCDRPSGRHLRLLINFLLPLQWCGRPSGRHLRLLIMVGRLGHHQLCRRRPRTLLPGPITLWLFLAGVLRLRHFFLVVADRRRPRPWCALCLYSQWHPPAHHYYHHTHPPEQAWALSPVDALWPCCPPWLLVQAVV